eukprot:scaffold22586_cov138-Cylindrotheca_fusiformis.AAC.39
MSFETKLGIVASQEYNQWSSNGLWSGRTTDNLTDHYNTDDVRTALDIKQIKVEPERTPQHQQFSTSTSPPKHAGRT